MSSANRANGRDAAAQNGASSGSKYQSMLWQVGQMIVIYSVIQYGMSFIMQKPQHVNQKIARSAAGYDDKQPLGRATDQAQKTLSPDQSICRWELGQRMSLRFFVNEAAYYNPPIDCDNVPDLVWKEENLIYGNWQDSRRRDTMIDVPRAVQNNASLYGHLFLSIGDAVLERGHEQWKADQVFYMRKTLTRYQRKARVRKAKNLLSGEEEYQDELKSNELAGEIVSHWYPNVTISLVNDRQPIAFTKVPPAVRKFVTLDAKSRRDPTGTFYLHDPVVWDNDFWLLQSNVYPINHTTTSLPLYLSYQPIGLTKFNILASLDESFKQQSEMLGGGSSGELDEVKRIFLEGNPYLLGITIFVSLLHSLFEFLAFKNDVSHFKNLKDNTGISVRTIVSNVIMQLIITLYLFDQKEGTSWVILGSQGVGVAIEAWKITRAVKISIIHRPKSLVPYRIKVEDKHQLSATEQKTKEADKTAFFFLTLGLVPLIFGYAGWSLLYQEHKSVYSFMVGTLAGCVYTYGFVLLLPQLYVNYQLKSVAHIPFRAMIYKFLNTIVDDLGGFIIAMPILHRISLFKDDVAFLILIYQMWIYPVDKTRVNEFGQGPEPNLVSEEPAGPVVEQDESKKTI